MDQAHIRRPFRRSVGALQNLGLGGDGDEWDAIERVEASFGVTLDPDDAPGWITVGDVYASLLAALPRSARNDATTWWRAVAALAEDTGADPRRIRPSTRLLAVPIWVLIKCWLSRFRPGTGRA